MRLARYIPVVHFKDNLDVLVDMHKSIVFARCMNAQLGLNQGWIIFSGVGFISSCLLRIQEVIRFVSGQEFIYNHALFFH